MKQFITFFTCLLLAGAIHAQTIFVKSNATGTNNGTSWANAYVSLDAALLSAATGQQIWVAAGTYVPTTGILPNNSFVLESGVSIYGGFAGTETALSQRNLVANVTVLSGDLGGNDVPGDFTLNRTDNSTHVLAVINGDPADRSVVDGFTIRAGHTLTGSANPDQARRGAGMLVLAKVTVRNCAFTDNDGESGGGIAALDAEGSDIIVEDCRFYGNKVSEQAAGLLLRSSTAAQIKRCVFSDNSTNRGSLYPLACTGVTIDSCLFENNSAGVNFGAGMYSWQSNWTMTNSIFRGNKARNAAGIYIDNRDGGKVVNINNCLFENDTITTDGARAAGIYTWQATLNLKNTVFRNNYAPRAAAMYIDGREHDSAVNIDSCTFENNTATVGAGGAISSFKTNNTITNSIFRNNITISSGAALYHSDSCEVVVNNCLFEANEGNYAAAVANYGLNCDGSFVGCTFRSNKALSGGGAISNGFKANVGYKDCLFDQNIARFGGAIFTQNDTTRLWVENCQFTENGAETSGGGILVNNNIAAHITGSTFFANSGDIGGAIQADGDSLLLVENTIFTDNLALTQAAGVNLSDANARFVNCLFVRNINFGAGAGGGISNNSTNDLTSHLQAVNCTFGDNQAVIGAAIAQWEDVTGNAVLELQNCIFQNPDQDNYAIELGDPQVISLNGNQSSDQTLVTYLTGNKDQHEALAAFVSVDLSDYHLSGGIAVDGGVAQGAPTADLEGNPHIGPPDRGCYEYGTSGVHSIGFQTLPMQCAPNPVRDYAMISFENDRLGAAEIAVWAQQGQRVMTIQTQKTAPGFTHQLDFTNLPAGSYRVQVRLGALVHEGLVVKQ